MIWMMELPLLLWNWKMPHSREISEVLAVTPFNFLVWNNFAKEIESQSGFEKYLMQGEILFRKREVVIRKSLERAEEVEFEGYKCLMVNYSEDASSIGNALAEKMPPIGIVWSRRGNKMIFSLRSDGTVDVAELAGRYGGGGHKAAAGFSWEDDSSMDFEKHRLL